MVCSNIRPVWQQKHFRSPTSVAARRCWRRCPDPVALERIGKARLECQKKPVKRQALTDLTMAWDQQRTVRTNLTSILNRGLHKDYAPIAAPRLLLRAASQRFHTTTNPFMHITYGGVPTGMQSMFSSHKCSTVEYQSIRSITDFDLVYDMYQRCQSDTSSQSPMLQ